MARLIASTDRIADYLGGLGEGERAELHGEAVERVSMFLECFPPLEPRWRPVAESRLRADLCDDRVVLSGKVDLTVGRADGVRAGKVLVDLKTGGLRAQPRRRPALLRPGRDAAPRRATPAARPATTSTGDGSQDETVTEDLLAERAASASSHGVAAAVALRHEGREPVLRPGPPCRWCPLREDCADGRRWLEERADQDGW